MKTLKTIAILLLIITALHAIARAQDKYKLVETMLPCPDYKGGSIQCAVWHGTRIDTVWNISKVKNGLFSSLDDNKRVAILVGDTLWVNKKFEEIKGVKEAVFELRYLRYKNKVYRYSYLYFDYGYFWTQHKKGKELW